jgi:hypothetical protein
VLSLLLLLELDCRAYEKADNEHHLVLPSTRPDFSVQSEGWQGSIKAADQSMDEASAKEEEMMVEEFVRRMNFNKMQVRRVLACYLQLWLLGMLEN